MLWLQLINKFLKHTTNINKANSKKIWPKTSNQKVKELNILTIIKSSLHNKIKTKEKNPPTEIGRM